MLSSARRLLLLSAFCAYVAAAKVALSGPTPKVPPEIDARADSLLVWFVPLSVVAGVCFLGLAITRGHARSRPSPSRSRRRFEDRRFVPIAPDSLFEHLLKRASPPVAVDEDNLELQDPADRQLLFSRVTWLGARFISVSVRDVDGDSIISVLVDYVGVLPENPVGRYVLRREAKLLTERLNRLEEWAREAA